jgi:arylformamidase
MTAMTPIDLQALYFNRGLVPDHMAIFAGWAKASEALRQRQAPTRLQVGPKPRHILDVFEAGPNAPVHLFVHGGYWQATDPALHHFVAEGPLAHGITTAFAGYTLAPEASIDDIVAEIRASVIALCRHVGKPITISGHSAGGHLTGAMMVSDWSTTRAALGFDPILAGMPISGVFELEPLLKTTMNDALKLDVAAARRNSIRLWPAPRNQRAVIVVGGEESSEFLRQTRGLAVAWMASGVECSELIVPGTNHFTVLADLAAPDGSMAKAVAALAFDKPLGA